MWLKVAPSTSRFFSLKAVLLLQVARAAGGAQTGAADAAAAAAAARSRATYKKDWASVARGAARSPYDGGPRLESNEPSLYEGSDEEF